VDNRPSTQVFVRRRLMVAFVFIAVFVGLSAGAGSVLANRGGAPASTSAVRSATSYVVQPGDTLWSIAQQFHGGASQVNYVDALVAALGDASLQVGQVITLP
jgi:LysM repeat protein